MTLRPATPLDTGTTNQPPTAEEGGALPAIAITGYAGNEESERALAAGYQAQLTKPVNWSDLIQTIVTLTRNGR